MVIRLHNPMRWSELKKMLYDAGKVAKWTVSENRDSGKSKIVFSKRGLLFVKSIETQNFADDQYVSEFSLLESLTSHGRPNRKDFEELEYAISWYKTKRYKL